MIIEKEHNKYMQRCMDLARNGFGNTAPNPMVGSVIVYNNKIIGEGYHRKAGEAHAEVNAINSVKNKELLKKASLYVNLEPCAHYGKTPPCANLIVSLGIPNIIIGTVDTAAHVSGKGIQILKDAGCNVITGILENECRELNKRFFTFHEQKRPYIILKWAQTKDSFIDIKRNSQSKIMPTWITNEYAKSLVHKWRFDEQAILVGTNTVLADNPTLNTRNWIGKSPLRVVFDRELKLDKHFNIFDSAAETLIIADITHSNKQKNAYNSNVSIKYINYSHNFYNQLFTILYKRNIQSLIVEGGELVLNGFIHNNLWDEARVFHGSKEFFDGIKAPKLGKKEEYNDKIGDSKLTFILNKGIFSQ